MVCEHGDVSARTGAGSRNATQAWMRMSMMRGVVAGLLAIFASGPAFAASGLPASTPAAEQAPPTAPPASTQTGATDVETYAAREQATQGALEKFAGGGEHGVYIGSGALVVVLLVVIVLLLL
jgi:hypothetical protein